MKQPKETVLDVKYLMDEWDWKTNSAFGISPDKLAAQSNAYAYWQCRYGHKWRAKINNRYNGRGCPECKKRLKTSFPEQAVFYYIKHVFSDAKNSYKDIFDNGMELDVYIPSIKTGIEYDGIAWHSDSNLYKEKKKYCICKDNGITLYRIKENLEHFHNVKDVADYIIPMRVPFSTNSRSYFALDIAIRTLLYVLGDCSCSNINIFSNGTGIIPSTEGTIIAPYVKECTNTKVDTKFDKNLIYESYLVNLEGNSFGEQFPDVAKMWHPTKNGNLTPYMFSPNSNNKVWWIGACGHEWDNPIAVMSRGQGCPICHGLRVLKGYNDLATKYPEIAKQWHPTLNGNKKPDMFTYGSGHKAFWLCPKCKQSWQTAINNRIKHGCPYCANERAIVGVNDLLTLRPDLSSEWNYDKNGNAVPQNYMVNSNKKVWWKCSKCGYEYQSIIANRTKGTGCKQCAGQVLISGKNDLEHLFPQIAKEWDMDANHGIIPSAVFSKSDKKYWWRCSLGHLWSASPNSRTRGNGCPICAGNKVLAGFNDIGTTCPDIAKQWHPTLNGELLPTQVSKGYSKKVWFLCDKCNNPYQAFISNKIKGYGACPFCTTRKTRAKSVMNVETGKRFNTLKEAAISVGANEIKRIQACCVGRTQTAYGFHWKYVKQ